MFAVACDGYVWVAADYVVKAGVGRGDDVADPFAAGGGKMPENPYFLLNITLFCGVVWYIIYLLAWRGDFYRFTFFSYTYI